MRQAGLGLVAVLLAACMGPDLADVAQPIGDPPSWWSELPLSGPAATEPSIALSPDGLSAYVVAPGGPGNDTPFWRVDLADRSVRFLGNVPTPVGDLDDDIEVDEAGGIWLTTLWEHEPGSTRGAAWCSAVAHSADGGAGWSVDVDGCGQPLPVKDRPWLAHDARNGLLLSLEFVPSGPSVLHVATSLGGGPWTEGDAILDNGNYAKPAWNGKEWVVALFPYSGSSGQPVTVPVVDEVRTAGPVLYTSADGRGWQASAIAAEPADLRFPSLDVDGQDGVVTWVVAKPTSQVRADFEADGVWGSPVSLEEGGGNSGSWAAQSGRHRAVAWLHASEDGAPCAVSEGAEWRLHVWQDGVLREVPRVIHRGPLFSSFLDNGCPEGSRRLGDFFTVDVAPSGAAVVAVTDGVQGNDGTRGPGLVFLLDPVVP